MRRDMTCAVVGRDRAHRWLRGVRSWRAVAQRCWMGKREGRGVGARHKSRARGVRLLVVLVKPWRQVPRRAAFVVPLLKAARLKMLERFVL